MSRRIDIELTSARPDGTWTWRAAGAREPKGVVDGALLPEGAKAGSVFRAEAEVEIDGMTIVAVSDPKGKVAKSGLLELIREDKPFEAVTQQLARRDRGERPRRDRDRPDRRDRPGGDRPGGDRPRRDRPEGERPGRDGERRDDRQGPGGDRRRQERPRRPAFTPPPELPQRPKAKRLKPGRAHRNGVLADLPEAQRPVAERALQGGIPAVRQAVDEQNARLKAEGKELVPAAGLVAMAEQLLPRLRVAEWLDRADAAKADLDDLDLRDLRSVVASADDPMVARDESTRTLATELKEALAAKQEKELQLWFGDIDAAVGVGRVIRALKLSSQPPKAGIRFPADLAKRLADAATGALTPDAAPDRWSAVLEAAAFSPVRQQVTPAAAPAERPDELMATVRRLAPLLPQVASLFGVEVTAGSPLPKPLRPTKPAGPTKKGAPAPKRAPQREQAAAPAEQPSAPASTAEAPAPADAREAVEQAPATDAPDAVEQAPTADAADDVDAAENVAAADDAGTADETAAPADEAAASADEAAAPADEAPASADEADDAGIDTAPA